MAPFARQRAAAGGLLGDSLLRLAGDDADTPDLNLARQQVILRLLQQVPMTVKERSATVMLLLQCGILTQEALYEIAWGAMGTEAAPPAAQAGLLPIVPAEVGQVVPAAPALPGANPERRASSEGLSLLGSRPRFEHDFERLELLGRGAFGEVWRCRHRVDGQEYAIKAVRYQAGAADIADVELRVLREAKTWASVSHPNIARYHNSWVEVEWEPRNLLDSRTMAQILPPQCNSLVDTDANPRITEVARQDSTQDESEAGEFSTEYTGGESQSDVVFGEPSASAGTGNSSPASSATGPAVKATHVTEPESPTHKGAQEVGELMLANPGLRRPGRVAAAINGGALPARISEAPKYRAILYIQAELCSKETLMAWIAKKNAALTSASTPSEAAVWARQAANIFRQCVVAIAHLHKLGCAHRDIKPSNIFLTEDGSVRIGDFGLARAAALHAPPEEDSPDGAHERREAQVLSSGVGTPTYASPEQLRGREYGVETDVFALGVVLAELLCTVGTHMERAVLLEDLRAHRQLPVEAVAAFPLAARLVLAMTHPDPAERPSARDIMKVLGEDEPKAARSAVSTEPGSRASSASDVEEEADEDDDTDAPEAVSSKRHLSHHCRARSRRLKRAALGHRLSRMRAY